MARKRPVPIETPEEPITQNPRKRTKKTPSDNKSGILSLHPPSPSLSPSNESQGAQCADSAAVEKELYTESFFADMVYTIAHIFPFEQFAQDHGCAVSLVSQALMATVVAPYSDPTFDWQEDPDWTIVGFGTGLVHNWKWHYNEMLEKCRPPCPGRGDEGAENFPTSPTSSSSYESTDSTRSIFDKFESVQQEMERMERASSVVPAPLRPILKSSTENPATDGRSKKSLSWEEQETLLPDE